MKRKIYVFGGGTFSDVRNHLALAARARGQTAKYISNTITQAISNSSEFNNFEVIPVYTSMADSNSTIVTNQDVSDILDKLIADPLTKCIIFSAALVDFDGKIDNITSGSHANRLLTSNGITNMELHPTEKLIGKIRKNRKDIFVVGFKTTTNETPTVQYQRGLELLKKNSLNLVLANDTVTRNNIIIAPEETRYNETTDRTEVLNFLIKMTLSRMTNHFTRSTVIDGDPVDWNGKEVPDNLRNIVNHCIKAGAYKPVLGKTAGHFAVKLNDNTFLTSVRKTNYNDLDKIGLVKVVSTDNDSVIAYGRKPSVGGQSQRQVYHDHPEADCIVHFHCPPKISTIVPTASQWPNECGSHECGRNTSKNLQEVDLGNGDLLKVVYLDNHGPNIVFSKNTPAHKIINYIDNNFDLTAKTGGLVMV